MQSSIITQRATNAQADPKRALERALSMLRGAQRDDHSWAGVLSSSALATAMSVVALHLSDAETHAALVSSGRRWLIQTQNDDGGWGDAMTDASNINATSLALGALTYTGREDDDSAVRETLRRGEERLTAFGGWEAVGDPNRCTLSGPCRTVAALAGILEWDAIKRLRPEVIYLPAPVRRTISTTYPAYLSIAMLHASRAAHPLNSLPTYPDACRRAMEWLARAQGPNGSFEESAFLSSVIITCMTATGHADLPWLPPAIQFVVDSQRPDGGWPIDRDLETFDTDMTVFAFTAAGEAVPEAPVVREWLLRRQFEAPCFPTGAKPGGWAWAMPAGWPDSDDTAYTLLALRALGEPAGSSALRRGARWLEDMQCSNGGWSTFVRNSNMPFDHHCPYITGHALSALHAVGRLHEQPKILDRALAYLRREQRYDGSFASIWFREATAGTASVLEALADCDMLSLDIASRARDYLLRSQNDDGGWSGLRLMPSTAEETSWAMMALSRCPLDTVGIEAVRRGAMWLALHQYPDGTWTPAPIGLYYSAMWYSDSYYAVTLPAQALARARAAYGWA